MATLASRIKELRKSAGLTGEEFGKIFGIAKSTVSLYENGKSTPDDEIKKAICDYFKISFDYLLGRDNPSHEKHNKDFPLSSAEKEIIKKYRALPPQGKETIDTILNLQYELVAPKIEDAAM